MKFADAKLRSQGGEFVFGSSIYKYVSPNGLKDEDGGFYPFAVKVKVIFDIY